MIESLEKLFANQPTFRLRQIKTAWFDQKIKNWDGLTTLSKEWRQKLSDRPWLPCHLKTIRQSSLDGTEKALLEFFDGELVETVLMARPSKRASGQKEERFTVCLSAQAGCPVKCAFCATGAAGFKRNLTAEEIVGQYRFWFYRLAEKGGLIDNIVLMGQGEPLLNYSAVRQALTDLIDFAKIGPSKITVSTVGQLSGLEKLLADPDWPPVRLAISLHSAIDETRKKIIPSHERNFFSDLIPWAVAYHRRFKSRTQFIGLEYLMLGGFNDDDKHLRALIKLASKLGRVRINLIPFNSSGSSAIFLPSSPEKIKEWHDQLMKKGFIATVRRSQGADIEAACGQLRGVFSEKYA